MVDAVNLGDTDLEGLVRRLQSGGQELALLVCSKQSSEFAEMPQLMSHFFRFPTDWVAFDPEPPHDMDRGHTLTGFSLSLVKRGVLESLLSSNVRRLDANSIEHAKRLKWRCHRIPSTEHLFNDIERLRERGVPVSDLVR